MSNVPAFIDRLRIIAKALEAGERQAKERAIAALRAAADYLEDVRKRAPETATPSPASLHPSSGLLPGPGESFAQYVNRAAAALATPGPVEAPQASPEPSDELTPYMLAYAMGRMDAGMREEYQFRLFWRFAMEARAQAKGAAPTGPREGEPA